jgi:hypothetical protein
MKVDDKIDLRPAIQKLATKDLNRLLSVDIGELTYDVDLDGFRCDSAYHLDDIKAVPLDVLVSAMESWQDLVLIYEGKKPSGPDGDNFDMKNVLKLLPVKHDNCPICGEEKFCLPIKNNIGEFPYKYKEELEYFMENNEYICAECQQNLLDGNIGTCAICGRLESGEDGYCSECY